MDPIVVPDELARVREGTRIRLFYREQGDRYACSGTLRSLRGGEVMIAPDNGGELTVAVSAVTCFYVPKPTGARAPLLRALGAALRRLVPADEPRPLARLPEDAAAPARPDSSSRSPRAPEQPVVPALER
jgi:hypothetical protein